MDIPIYKSLEDFKENYLVDFSAIATSSTLLNYLSNLKKIYKDLESSLSDDRSDLYYSKLGIKQSKELKYKMGIDFDLIESYIDKLIWQNYQPTQMFGSSVLFDDNEILLKINKEVQTKNFESFENEVAEYINERYSSLIRMRDYYFENIVPINKIRDFIDEEIAREKVNILRNQGPDRLQQLQIDEPEPITEKEIDKIRLLHETGIINFLLEKYPTTNPNQIAKFFELISSEPMIAKNNNSSFTNEITNVKYPMKNLSFTKKQKIKTIMQGFGFVE